MGPRQTRERNVMPPPPSYTIRRGEERRLLWFLGMSGRSVWGPGSVTACQEDSGAHWSQWSPSVEGLVSVWAFFSKVASCCGQAERGRVVPFIWSSCGVEFSPNG